MSVFDSIVSKSAGGPRRIMVYGVHGVGKSTFAASAPKPIFIQTEDGLGDIENAARFPLAMSFRDVITQLRAIATEPHDYRTVVVDSLDWLERLIWADVCQEREVKSIEDIGYAKGYVYAMTQWRKVLADLNKIRSRGFGVILVAHSIVEKFVDPEREAYDRFAPRLHKHASGLIQEWCDEVLFATYRIHTKKEGEGLNARHRGIGGETRVLRTTYRPAHVAKNRLNLPDEIPFDWATFATYVAKNRKEKSDV